MDILQEYFIFESQFPRNFSRRFVLSYYFEIIAKKKVFISLEEAKQLTSKIMPEDELPTKKSINRITNDIYNDYRKSYNRMIGIYNHKGGRFKKNLCT